jgi:hypothetical protein
MRAGEEEYASMVFSWVFIKDTRPLSGLITEIYAGLVYLISVL